MIKRIKEIYQYRTMISSLVKRDLKGRYSGSVLGVLWNFLSPLLQLLVYTFVFSAIMRMGMKDYYLFLFVALVPWIFFSTSVAGGTSCILQQADMVKKIYFPREVIPIAHVCSQFVNMLLCFVVVFVVMIVKGYAFNYIALLFLPIVMIVEFVLALGFAMLLSAMAVFFRDLQHIMGIIILAWQFLSPVMYGSDMVPERFLFIFNMNPMTHVITAYREILYYANVPSVASMRAAIIIGCILFVVGWLAFNKLQKHFIEVM